MCTASHALKGARACTGSPMSRTPTPCCCTTGSQPGLDSCSTGTPQANRCPPRSCLGTLHRIDPISIESQVTLDRLDGRVGLLVGPHRIHGLRPARENAVVGAIALVRTVS